MGHLVWAVEIKTRTIPEAIRGVGFRVLWRYYRRRWIARLVVWWINNLGPGRDYERARLLGETL